VFIVLFIPKAFQSQIKEFCYVINLPKYTSASPLHLRKGMNPVPVPEAMFILIQDAQEHTETE
jgi:hypothetical protein